MQLETREEIQTELEMMTQTIGRLQDLMCVIGDQEPSDHQMAAVGAYLANYYNGVENILKRLVQSFEANLPSGANWHAELLFMFQEGNAKALAPIINAEMFKELKNYLAFRHLFVHGYAIVLKWDRLRPNAENAPKLFAAFSLRIRDFQSQYEKKWSDSR